MSEKAKNNLLNITARNETNEPLIHAAGLVLGRMSAAMKHMARSLLITSSIAGYANAIGAQSQELSCNTRHKQHGLEDGKRRNLSFSENITFAKIQRPPHVIIHLHAFSFGPEA